MLGPYSGRNDNLVELKTSMNIRGPQDEARFEKWAVFSIECVISNKMMQETSQVLLPVLSIGSTCTLFVVWYILTNI